VWSVKGLYHFLNLDLEIVTGLPGGYETHERNQAGIPRDALPEQWQVLTGC